MNPIARPLTAALTTLTFTLPLMLPATAVAVSEATLADLRIPAEPAAIDIEEILSGGPPPQGIPALGFRGLSGVAGASQDPNFESQQQAAPWLDPLEPVILLRVGGEARIYPLQVLIWHEIANDTVGGVPIAVTFCPLCNSALAFDRRVPIDDDALAALRASGADLSRLAPTPDDLAAAYEARLGRAAPARALDVTFGVSGLLYFSNLLMFDEATRTLWSQLTGEGAVGPLSERPLVRYAAQIVGFGEARASEPDALVLSRSTGFARSYGINPYGGYDTIGSPAFLYRGPQDGRLDPKARVVTLDGETPVAYPFDHLAKVRVAHDDVAGQPIVAFWAPGTATALGAARIASAEDIGAVGVFRPVVEGSELRFELRGDDIVDGQTGSVWDVTGRAVEGPLAGARLEPMPHDNTLWFAWAAFRPQTEVRTP